MALLELKDVCKNFGKLQAVSDLNFTVEKGQIHSLIGPNGAGKTTVFNLITGTFPVTSGQVFFNGENITGKPPHKIAQKGMSRSFQQTYLFMFDTVFSNLMMGFHMSCKSGVIKEFLHTPLARKTDQECRKKALEILDFMGLSAVKDELPVNKSRYPYLPGFHAVYRERDREVADPRLRPVDSRGRDNVVAAGHSRPVHADEIE